MSVPVNDLGLGRFIRRTPTPSERTEAHVLATFVSNVLKCLPNRRHVLDSRILVRAIDDANRSTN